MKKTLQFITLLTILLLILTILCGCFYWSVGILTGLVRRRAVWVDSNEINSFADNYIISSFTTVEMPGNYPNLKASHYLLLDQTKQEFTPEEFCIDGAAFIMEFDFNGEAVYAIVNISKLYNNIKADFVGPKYNSDGKYNLNKAPSERILACDYTRVIGNDENGGNLRCAVISYEFYYGRLAFIDGYKADASLDYIIKYMTKNAVENYKEWYVYGVKELESSDHLENYLYFGAIIFLDNRNIPEDEKTAWHMQVVNDVKNNSYDNYWTQQQ